MSACDNYRNPQSIQSITVIAFSVVTFILDIIIFIYCIKQDMLFASGGYGIKFCEYFTMIADLILVFTSISFIIFLQRYSQFILILKALFMCVVVIAKEICFNIFINCYNYSSIYLILTRIIIQFLFVSVLIIMIIVSLVCYRKGYCSVKTEDEPVLNSEKSRKLKIIFGITFILALAAVIISNTIILVYLKKIENNEYSVNNINLVYLDNFNYQKLINNELQDSSKISTRVLTKLSKLTQSNILTTDFVCSAYTRKNCRFVKLRMQQINIECTNSTSEIFSDCLNALSLKLVFYYREDEYPKFYCSVRTTRNECQPGCDNFLKDSKIALTQKYQNKILPAWYEKCNCYKPKIELTEDDTINICNLSKDGWNL